MSLHTLLPLVALLLNVSLAAIALVRNPDSRLNRMFAYFVGSLAIWNLGVFGLRTSGTADAAFVAEVFIHIGVIVLPAFYYHFILIFFDSTIRHRRSLIAVYAVSFFFTVVNLARSPWFMKGVIPTYWGWAPATGPLYLPFFVFWNTVLLTGLFHLNEGYRALDSSFWRNRAMLIRLGSLVSLGGGFVDFLRFILARSFPAADLMYPLGIPANMFFALLLGTSIVRYRLFDVNVAVKKGLLYLVMGGALTSFLVGVTRALERYFGWDSIDVLWVVVPVGFLGAMALGRVDAALQRVMLGRRRGCYDTLVDLSKRMSTILDLGRLMDTLVHRLVRGIPLTRCVLLIEDAARGAFIPYRAESGDGTDVDQPPLGVDSAIVQWLRRSEGVLLKEEIKLNPEMASHFATAEAEFDDLAAAVIVPLKIDNRLVGIVLLGEKLSGEIFDAQELEVLRVLANQAAIALENARLYQEVGASNARLLHANQLKSQFLASVSHELRTPLNSIIGFSRILLKRSDGDLNDRQEAYLRAVHSSSTHLLDLINSVLDITRIEAGKTELVYDDLDLRPLLDECLVTTAPLARGKALKLEYDIPPALPAVHADRTKLKQVVLNLLSNAVKFTAAGTVLLHVEVHDDEVHVTVADTGIGIAEAEIPRLFQPFERIDSPTTRGVGGTGLGLAISRKFVEMHGGRIWVENREPHGCSFHFTIPLAAERRDADTTEARGVHAA